jgi:hypothetical protein
MVRTPRTHRVRTLFAALLIRRFAGGAGNRGDPPWRAREIWVQPTILKWDKDFSAHGAPNQRFATPVLPSEFPDRNSDSHAVPLTACVHRAHNAGAHTFLDL